MTEWHCFTAGRPVHCRTGRSADDRAQQSTLLADGMHKPAAPAATFRPCRMRCAAAAPWPSGLEVGFGSRRYGRSRQVDPVDPDADFPSFDWRGVKTQTGVGSPQTGNALRQTGDELGQTGDVLVCTDCELSPSTTRCHNDSPVEANQRRIVSRGSKCACAAEAVPQLFPCCCPHAPPLYADPPTLAGGSF